MRDVATGPGRTILTSDELLVGIVIPKLVDAERRFMLFDRVGQRRALAVAIASVALCGRLEGGRFRDV